jgi:hypothetical protein
MSLVMAISSDAFSPVKIPQKINQRASSLRPASSFVKIPTSTSTSTSISPLFANEKRSLSSPSQNSRAPVWKRILRRFDTLESAGFDPDTVLIGGLFRRVKDLHNPITYIAIGLLTGLKYQWCFRNPYYWFVMAFCVKWYRARYVFKIPVWDRQPNWNNIITSKEQEKDLKAFTCKNCGSTIFIAKTREFFFEGDTGIGGLGCFACGAKGKENFTNEREKIVEEVADIDDYFEYERPLDFVTAAERRQLLKDAKGDEEAANKLYIQRTGGDAGGDEAGTPESPETDATIEDAVIEEEEEEAQQESYEVDESEPDVAEAAADEVIDVIPESTPEPKAETKAESKKAEPIPKAKAETRVEPKKAEPASEPKAEKKAKPKKASKAAPKPAPIEDDDMDILDMD